MKDKPHITTLCGFKPDQTEADLSDEGLDVGDAIFLAFDLKRNSVLVKLECARTTNHRSVSSRRHLCVFSFVHSVSENFLKAEGAKHMASTLAINQTLTSVKYAASHLALAVTSP